MKYVLLLVIAGVLLPGCRREAPNSERDPPPTAKEIAEEMVAAQRREDERRARALRDAEQELLDKKRRVREARENRLRDLRRVSRDELVQAVQQMVSADTIELPTDDRVRLIVSLGTSHTDWVDGDKWEPGAPELTAEEIKDHAISTGFAGPFQSLIVPTGPGFGALSEGEREEHCLIVLALQTYDDDWPKARDSSIRLSTRNLPDHPLRNMWRFSVFFGFEKLVPGVDY